MPDLDDVRDFLADEHGLAVVSTTQADGRVLSTVVNCGVCDHSVTGDPMIALVSRGGAARLGHLRRGSDVTVAVQRGWRWIGITGPCDLIGPDDPSDGLSTEQFRMLLREVYQSAGGDHDDYEEYDRSMAEDRRACMFVTPARILGRL